MHCKNCEFPLQIKNQFCANCGAKVIRNKLTFKNLWTDFSERFFNYDNTLIKTVKHMFSKPGVVIESFIGGTRKKYLNPLNFFLISLTVTGLYNFIYKYFLLEAATKYYENTFKNFKSENMFSNNSIDLAWFLENFNLFAFAIIPIIAIITKITFLNLKKHNYTEHIVINLYTISQYQLVTSLVSLPLLFLPIGIQNMIGFLFLMSFMFYFFYVFTSIYKLEVKQLFIKFFIASLLVLGLFILIFILGVVFAILSKTVF